MKYLEIAPLEAITSSLNFEVPDSQIFGRVEAYSCKSASNDKKLYKALESKYGSVGSAHSPAFSSPPPPPFVTQSTTAALVASSVSPPPTFFSPSSSSPHDLRASSPFGSLDQPSSRKALFYLIATLNASFPDYDFTETKPSSCFRHHYQLAPVVNEVNTTLSNVGRGSIVRELALWDVMDQIVELSDCEIYSYDPDGEENPYDGALWSLNYFFFNRKIKRLVFLSLHSVRINSGMEDMYSPGGEYHGSGGTRQPHTSGTPSDDDGIIDNYEDYITAEMEF
ncbi:MAG: Maf1 regulator-domain-containing protein [Piptocephalis tieghemiana]|nr:MAG: Maf1 regulator-domain-containing protein [Piptocephalis tieghemiana]